MIQIYNKQKQQEALTFANNQINDFFKSVELMKNKPKIYKQDNWWVCECVKYKGIAQSIKDCYAVWRSHYAK